MLHLSEVFMHVASALYIANLMIAGIIQKGFSKLKPVTARITWYNGQVNTK